MVIDPPGMGGGCCVGGNHETKEAGLRAALPTHRSPTAHPPLIPEPPLGLVAEAQESSAVGVAYLC